MSIVDVVVANSVEEFIAALQPKHEPYWGTTIFRGQSLSTYKLISSAYRDESQLLALATASDKRHGNVLSGYANDPIFAEARILQIFCQITDFRGLSLPSNNIKVNEMMGLNRMGVWIDEAENVRWPQPEIWEILGLAQHYGLPTRLLDWTMDWQFAAYWAAKRSLIHKQKENEDCSSLSLSVWKGPTHMFNTDEENRVGAMIKTVRPPMHGNPNLSAQKGIFTLIKMSDDISVVDWDTIGHDQHREQFRAIRDTELSLLKRPLDEVLADMYANPPSDRLVRVDLSYQLVDELFSILLRDGCDAARYFPGYQGAAEACRELELLNV